MIQNFPCWHSKYLEFLHSVDVCVITCMVSKSAKELQFLFLCHFMVWYLSVIGLSPGTPISHLSIQTTDNLQILFNAQGEAEYLGTLSRS